MMKAVTYAFLTSATALLIAAFALLYLAMPVKVQAQIPALDCGPQFGTVNEVRIMVLQLGGDFRELSPDEVDRYLDAVNSGRPSNTEGMPGAYATLPTGGSVFAFIEQGVTCFPALTITPESHQDGLRQLTGMPT